MERMRKSKVDHMGTDVENERTFSKIPRGRDKDTKRRLGTE